MAITLFNLHDLILLLTSFICLIFAGLILSNNQQKKISSYLFAVFLLSHAFISLHELIIWGSTFRNWVIDFSPNIYFSLNFAYCIDAAALYLFFYYLANSTAKLSKKLLIHLIPAVVFMFYLYWAYYGLASDIKIARIIDREILYSDDYLFAQFLINFIRMGYLTVILLMMLNRKKEHFQNFIAITQLNNRTVKSLFLAFYAIILLEFSLSAIKYIGVFFPQDKSFHEWIGLSSYYLQFMLINVLVFVQVRRFLSLSHKQKFNNDRHIETINPEIIQRLELSMQQDKLYRNPLLSIERLAEQIDLPAKDLSNAINRHFEVNFLEYINSYRLNEAKLLLQDSSMQNQTITEIYTLAGFNTKSVFNTLFKKHFNQTPSEYRKQFVKR